LIKVKFFTLLVIQTSSRHKTAVQRLELPARPVFLYASI